ncbi:MAG: folylpolyglutamate synthase/dihydrofolate synthase [Firmicutes bacterium]|nr:folylpolyglutamate synthase/dihydrofolate synthase [Bacillota bacterium]
MRVIEKIEKVENKRGRNHELALFRSWLDEKCPRHKELKNIQIAGTNGKGSTSQWLMMFLKENGKRVGVFTSPHLISHTERIRINEENISLEDWERIYDVYSDFFEEKEMTMFEIDLWMAVVYFVEQKVDYCVFEVGMGGQRDATTSLDYLVTAITNIGLDHQEYLGNTVEEIAQTKAGIFKKGVPALTSERKNSCVQVMEQQAQKAMTSFIVAHGESIQKDILYFVWKGKEYPFPQAKYQVDNLALALSILEILKEPAINIEEILSGFMWEGRCMLLQENPKRIVDGGHNPHGIRALVDSLPDFRGKIYFSVLKEKDAKEMLKMLEELCSPITLVHFDSYRLYPLEQLGYPIIDMEEMFKRLKEEKEDCLLCGSLYFVGDVLKHYKGESHV